MFLRTNFDSDGFPILHCYGIVYFGKSKTHNQPTDFIIAIR